MIFQAAIQMTDSPIVQAELAPQRKKSKSSGMAL